MNRVTPPLITLLLILLPQGVVSAPYYQWQMEDYAILAPLNGLKGDSKRGKKIVIDKSKGNCLACHAMPVTEEGFHGNIGPSLMGIASRLTEGQMRLRIVDQKQINPQTIMPGYYRDPKYFTLVLDDFEGKTFLSAQEVEDVVAYLMTLK